MRTLALIALAVLTWAAPAAAQAPYEVAALGAHNFGGAGPPQACAGCHIPPDTGDPLLAISPVWAPGAADGPFPVGIKNPDGGYTEVTSSELCLQCHDGVTAGAVNPPALTTVTPEHGGQSHPDHPVQSRYPRDTAGLFVVPTPLPQNSQFWSVPDVRNGQLVLPSGPTSTYQPIPAGADAAQLHPTVVRTRGGLVECDSCHNPHDATVRPFLRSLPPRLCLVCHDK
ncbi:MAG: cytochrome c3 family protein [Nitrospirae bacterium]|nr:cytochrome c3 family protein [Nitrospirota bacterium]